jgi:molybdopterin-guanine dinucleotide biosynthesis protein A
LPRGGAAAEELGPLSRPADHGAQRIAITAIVLAGGRSARFGADKLAQDLDGRPVLEHVLERVRAIASDVVVVRPPDAHDITAGARIVHDPEPFGGPLIGVLAGLEAAREPLSLVVGGDMPRLEPDVLTLMVRSLSAADPHDIDAVVLQGRGRVQPLPIAARTGAATTAAQRALGHGARSLTAWLEALRTRTLRDEDWRPLDPTAATLVDIDAPEDLETLR